MYEHNSTINEVNLFVADRNPKALPMRAKSREMIYFVGAPEPDFPCDWLFCIGIEARIISPKRFKCGKFDMGNALDKILVLWSGGAVPAWRRI